MISIKSSWRWVAAGLAIAALTGTLISELIMTAPVRESMQTLSRIIAESNQSEADTTRVELLCTSRYRATHRLRVAPEGGFVGLPRSVSKNFRAWREADKVWICPSNRDRNGPIYQFVREEGVWKFDGPVGILTTRGEILPMAEDAEGNLSQ
jgi:hypothetical protein